MTNAQFIQDFVYGSMPLTRPIKYSSLIAEQYRDHIRVLYSYGYHYPLAARNADCPQHVLINVEESTRTTERHKSILWGYVAPPLTRVLVDNVCAVTPRDHAYNLIGGGARWCGLIREYLNAPQLISRKQLPARVALDHLLSLHDYGTTVLGADHREVTRLGELIETMTTEYNDRQHSVDALETLKEWSPKRYSALRTVARKAGARTLTDIYRHAYTTSNEDFIAARTYARLGGTA